MSNEAETAARDGMQLTIRAVREDDGTPVFFFNGSFKDQDFSGTANDMGTAWSMATECLELISNGE